MAAKLGLFSRLLYCNSSKTSARLLPLRPFFTGAPTRLSFQCLYKPAVCHTTLQKSFCTTRPAFNDAKKNADSLREVEDLQTAVSRRKRPMADATPDDPVVVKVSNRKRKNPLGFFNISGMLLFLGGLFLLLSYRRRSQKAIDAFNQENEVKTFGKALIGGPFKLIDQNGNLFTEEDLLRKFSIIYFGFTLCPDICPEELDKLAIIVKNLKKEGIEVQPIFISCDPLRDTPQVVKKYLEEFDIEGIVGLTGSYKDVEACCKAYRVYFSTPPDIKPGEDYIVDHSIFFYLMDPEGEFVNVYGRRYNAEEASTEIAKKIRNWMPASQRRELSFKKPSFWKFWE